MKTADPPETRSIFKQIFLSPEEPRLRAGWRLLLHLILILIFAIPPSTVIFLLLLSIGQLELLSTVGTTLSVVNSLVFLLASLPATYLARRFLDRRSFQSLGLGIDRHCLSDLLIGFAIPGVLMGTIYLVELGMGWLNFEDGPGKITRCWKS